MDGVNADVFIAPTALHLGALINGGKFGNVVLAHGGGVAVRNDHYGAETRTSYLPDASVSIGSAATQCTL